MYHILTNLLLYWKWYSILHNLFFQLFNLRICVLLLLFIIVDLILSIILYLNLIYILYVEDDRRPKSRGIRACSLAPGPIIEILAQ